MAVPFTYNGYRQMISALRERDYRFAFFPQAQTLLESKLPFALMRHDVDLDLQAAATIARVEAELGVCSTYFVLLRTEHYNVFSERGTALIEGILSTGHELGLHFDCAAYPHNTIEQTGEACDQEANILERWFGTRIQTVSFHRPAHSVLNGNANLSGSRGHTYSQLYCKQIHYYSDSRGAWRFGSPLDQPAFQKREPLHVLTHPVWWSESARRPESALEAYLENSALRLRDSVAANCTVLQPAGSAK